MRNQIFKALQNIDKRCSNIGRNDQYSLTEVLEVNKIEIEFLCNKFNLKEEEALLLASSIITTIENRTPLFDLDDLASSISVNIFEILLCQKSLRSLIEKELLVEFPKEPVARNSYGIKSAIEFKNKEFYLHASVGEHLN